MTAISGVIIAPISRRSLVKGPVIAAAIACLAGSAWALFPGSSTSILCIVAVTLLPEQQAGYPIVGARAGVSPSGDHW